MRKLRHRQVKALAQDRRVSEMQTQDLKAGIFETGDQHTSFAELL